MAQTKVALTALEPVLVRKARLDDLEVILGILEEAARWLISKGVLQWHPGVFRHGPRRRQLAESINRGEVYLALLDGQVVGTVTVQCGRFDQQFWSDLFVEEALYMHYHAVCRAVAGKGVGLALLREAEKMTIRSGKCLLRLDCMAENPALCTYYEDGGFVCCSDVPGKGWHVKLYEKQLFVRAIGAEEAVAAKIHDHEVP